MRYSTRAEQREFNEKLGKKVLKCIKDKGHGKGKITAAELGISVSMLNKYCRGYNALTVYKLKQIADVLGIDIKDFFNE